MSDISNWLSRPGGVGMLQVYLDKIEAENELLAARVRELEGLARAFITGCCEDHEEGDGYWTEETLDKFTALSEAVKEEA